MPSQYRHRRTSAPATPFVNPSEPGEIQVNTANRQIAVGDANGASLGVPLNLLPIRYFDTRAIYAASDYVWNAGIIYKANKSTGPGAFVAADWGQVAGGVDP